MNIRKLMARLNAKAPQFHMGSGGLPEYTPQDIAAALGMVNDVIGREVFCMAWWPDGARLTRKDLRDSLKNLLFEEYCDRYRVMAAASLEVHLLENAQTPEAKRMLSKAKSELQAAKKASWPRNLEKFGIVAETAITEVCAPKVCKTCGGRGQLALGPKIIECEPCGGLGIVGVSNVWRAAQLGVGETAYRMYWRDVYEWLYLKVAKHESEAVKQLTAALSDVAQAA